MNTRTRAARVIDPTIGQNVTRERAAVSLTRDQLAEWMRNRGQTHWQKTTVERVENGQQRVDADELAALVYVLGSDAAPWYERSACTKSARM